MNASPPFLIGTQSDFEDALPETAPWSSSPALKRAALRLGWRCACENLPPGLVSEAEALQEKNSGTWIQDGFQVNVNVCLRRKKHPRVDSYEFVHVVVDLWIERARSAELEFRPAAEALEQVRKHIASSLRPKDLVRKQEFLEVRLPRFVTRRLTSDQARSAIREELARSSSGEHAPPTVAIADNQLILGPEPVNTANAAWRYVEKQTNKTSRETFLESKRLLPWIPVAMAVLLLLTWLLSVSFLNVTLVAVLFLVLMVLALYPVPDVGWRIMFYRTTTAAALGFFSIGAFGVAYAFCSLMSNMCGQDVSLGRAFLLSTSLGLAGGALGGEPTGAALVIAHIQLLLFLSSLIAVVAVLVRIDRGVRRRGE